MASVQDAYQRHFHLDSSPHPGQVWSWFFIRISGLLMVVLVLVHMAIMHVLGGGVEKVDFNFVAGRLAGPFWRTFDWFLLVLALVHGGLGARIVILDHVRPIKWKRLATTALYLVTAFMLVVGTVVLVTFDAPQVPGG